MPESLTDLTASHADLGHLSRCSLDPNAKHQTLKSKHAMQVADLRRKHPGRPLVSTLLGTLQEVLHRLYSAVVATLFACMGSMVCMAVRISGLGLHAALCLMLSKAVAARACSKRLYQNLQCREPNC